MNLIDYLADVNWLAVIVATLSAYALGALWYSKALFGEKWMQEVSLTPEAIAGINMPITYGTTFVLQFIAATALALFLGVDSTWLSGMFGGATVALLWVATAYGVTYLFEQRTLRLFLINAGYYVVVYAIMGTIIGAWH